jgi:hypothetical protein
MTVLQLLGNAFREVIEATLLIKIGAKLDYHMIYPHQLVTSSETQKMVPDERFDA